jgi:putative flavoprotein involved in K+ transport
VRGAAENEAGLYFVGLNFLYAMSSTMIHGVGRDACYVAEAIAQSPARR